MHWLVGDVQGCALELDDLLRLLRFDPAEDELWCLGDLVNRGPDSLAVLRLWRDMCGHGLLGNHDIYALLARAGRRERRKDTLDALFAAPDADELLARLRGLPVLGRMPGAPDRRDVWIVHAGLDPRWNDLEEIRGGLDAAVHDDDWLASPDVSFATCVRCCTADGQRCRYTGPPQACPAPFRPWDEFYGGPDLVVHGHWAQRGHYRGARTLGLDSGCVHGGLLSAWCLEEDRLVQVPSRSTGRAPTRFDLGRPPPE